LASCFFLFLWVISPIKDWEHPPESNKLDDIYKSYDNSPSKFLEELKNDYIRIIPACTRILSKKSTIFTTGVYLLSAGIFIVLMIKYGGGTLNVVIN